MPPAQPLIAGTAIVFAGDFPISLVLPARLMERGLLSQEEALGAVIDVQLPDLLSYRAGDLVVRCDDAGLAVESSNVADPIVLRDVAVELLRMLKGASTLRAVGINRYFHVPGGTQLQWSRISNRLMDESPWADLGYTMLRSITFGVQRPKSDLEGELRVSVEPSVKLPEGVFVRTNDHFELGSAPDPHVAARELLLSSWDAMIERADNALGATLSAGER